MNPRGGSEAAPRAAEAGCPGPGPAQVRDVSVDTREPNVLAVHPGALGDVILFGHLLARLDGPVTLVVGRAKAELLAAAGVVRHTLDFDAMPMHELFTDTPPGQCRLPALLGGHARLISCFAGGDRAAELRLAAMCRCQSAAFLPVRPPEGFTAHMLDLWSDLLGLSASATPAAWPVPDDWREAAEEELEALSIDTARPFVAIHPGAGAPEKCWPLERFRDLAKSCEQAVFVLGPAELDRWPHDSIDALRHEFPVLAGPALPTLAGLLAGARAFVGNDSGPAHLAAAVGAPTVALFGASRAEHFAPIGPAVRVIAAESIDAISVEQVAAALRQLTGRKRGRDTGDTRDKRR